MLIYKLLKSYFNSISHLSFFMGGSGSVTSYTIAKSLRLRSGAGLSRTFGAPTDSKKFTFSCRIKLGTMGTQRTLFQAYIDVNNFASIILESDNTLRFIHYINPTFIVDKRSTRVLRDGSGFYTLTVQFDSTQAVAEDRIKMYIEQDRITSWSTNTNTLALNGTTHFNTANSHNFGGVTPSIDCLLSEIYFIDGQVLDPTSFGKTDPNTLSWVPKKYTGTYGNSGFYLDFSTGTNLTTLGADKSGRGNNWTLNNVSLTAGATYDWLDDTPTNNYATWNPVDIGGGTLSDGNLKITEGGAGYAQVVSTQDIKTRVYAEFTLSTLSGLIGIQIGARNDAGSGGFSPLAVSYNTATSGSYAAGEVNTVGDSAAGTAYTAPSAGNVLMIAADPTTGKVWMGLQGVWFNSGNPDAGTGHVATISTSDIWRFAFNRMGGAGVVQANFGQRPWTYSPGSINASSFKALNTVNLPTPAIQLPKKHFNLVSVIGSASAQSISGVGHSSEFLWFKNRQAIENHFLADLVRGPKKILNSNTTNAESTAAAFLTSFDTDGFTVDASGLSSAGGANTYICSSWKAGGAAVANNSGSITSQVSANPTAGFSIVTGTMANGGGTFGHGLGVTPAVIIVKRRGVVDGWFVWNKNLSNLQQSYLQLNTTAAQTTGATVWNNTAPTSSVFSLGGGFAANGDTFVAYCFAEVPGYSKFGSYTGNGSADGPFVHLGFKPRWLMIKRTDVATDWYMWDTARDTFNQMADLLRPNLSAAEVNSAPYAIDAVSNGFKIRGAGAEINTSGGTYIYAAFAECPFKYATAR